jgi:hypothetical protein
MLGFGSGGVTSTCTSTCTSGIIVDEVAVVVLGLVLGGLQGHPESALRHPRVVTI